MKRRSFGMLGEISALALGGAGIGQDWGPKTRHEAVATVKEAVDAGIDFLDVAPQYGDREAELVVGEAFGGRLPQGVRISSKCHLGKLVHMDSVHLKITHHDKPVDKVGSPHSPVHLVHRPQAASDPPP